ncbi:MAG: hypothetical protein ACI4B6_08355 [Atopobiaceae bacterium]
MSAQLMGSKRSGAVVVAGASGSNARIGAQATGTQASGVQACGARVRYVQGQGAQSRDAQGRGVSMGAQPVSAVSQQSLRTPAQQALSDIMGVVLPALVVGVCIVALVLTELGVGNSRAWMYFLAVFGTASAGLFAAAEVRGWL